ncbi:MAG TPA: sugar phosphate isomerase/epimerase [Planctomycetaceae bacterium]|nr:sugar phosphate isomerase/epimerase [Planctomycetaceae bacterium]
MAYTRRQALRQIGAAGLVWSAAPALSQACELAAPLAFGFSLYGMKTVPVPRALKVCADIGYSGVELVCLKDWPCDPSTLTRDERKDFREQLVEHALDLPALMENLALVAPENVHAENLDRLKRAAELAHDLGGDTPPLIETVLGGKPDLWPQNREVMVERLRDWEDVAAKSRVVIAIKPHISGTLHRPDDCAWLVQQVRSRWIKAVFDYSHYQRQGLALKECVQPLIGEAVFVHIKDNVTVDGKTEFALPGDGDIDYPAYLQLLKQHGYRGPVVVEVSAQVFNKPGYNPLLAAEKCYEKLHRAFEQAGARARV